MAVKAVLMEESAVIRAMTRISHEILEKNRGTEDICLVGIRRRGAALAEMIADNILKFEGVRVPCGDIDISYYRDDISTLSDMPVLKKTELPFSIAGKKVILVDDVLYTGRTVRAAIEAVFSVGRPASIQLAILIDEQLLRYENGGIVNWYATLEGSTGKYAYHTKMLDDYGDAPSSLIVNVGVSGHKELAYDVTTTAASQDQNRQIYRVTVRETTDVSKDDNILDRR